MTASCPSCAQPASGRFCSHCGAAVDATCRECSANIPEGGRFCNQCGTPAGAAPAGAAEAERSSNLPWIIAGAALVALIAVVLLPQLRGGEEVAAPVAAALPASGAPMGDARSVDLASMTPREAADRLFNRVMQGVSGGDSVQARSFLPMAVQAYGMVPDLDTDGRYHLGVLHLVGGNPAGARAQADTILSADPNHLFGLAVAAQAEQQRGNGEAAVALFRRFLDGYPTEVARDLPEYREHQPALEEVRGEAERVAGAA